MRKSILITGWVVVSFYANAQQKLVQRVVYPLAVGNVWETDGDCPSKIYIEKDTTINGKTLLFKRVTESTCKGKSVEYVSNEARGLVKFRKEEGFSRSSLALSANYTVADTIRNGDLLTIVREVEVPLVTPSNQYQGLVKIETLNLKEGEVTYQYIKPGLGIVAESDRGGNVTSYLKKYTLK